MTSPEQKNFAEILRLEDLLESLRSSGAAGGGEVIREIGLEIALAVREVGAMLVNVGWEQTIAEQARARDQPQMPDERR